MNRRPLVILGLLLLLIVGGALLGSWLGGGTPVRFPSSYNAGPEGLLAFRLLLDELAIPVDTLREPWEALGDIDGSLLVVSTPLQRPVRREESAFLRGWLSGGGRLLVVDDATTSEEPSGLNELLDEIGLQRTAPVAELDMQTLTVERPATTAAQGTVAGPAGSDVREIELHADGRFAAEFRGVPLALSGDGDVVAGEARVGRGRVVRVLGPLLARDRLVEGGNLQLALRLVEDLRGGGVVLFDEFHHGYGGRLAGFRRLDRASLGWASVQAVVVMLLYGLARGRRFGPPRIVPESPRRSSLEFVHSMASLYRRAGFGRQMLERMGRRFARRARLSWGIDENLPASRLAAAAAARSGVEESRLANTLQAVERAEGRVVGEREMLGLARNLARLEEEVFGGNRPRS